MCCVRLLVNSTSRVNSIRILPSLAVTPRAIEADKLQVFVQTRTSTEELVAEYAKKTKRGRYECAMAVQKRKVGLDDSSLGVKCLRVT